MQEAQSRRTVNPFQLVRWFKSNLSHILINQVMAYAVAFCVERDVGIGMNRIFNIALGVIIYYAIAFFIRVMRDKNKR